MPNKANIQIIGHVGQAEMKSTNSGTPLLSFSVAVNHYRHDNANWYRVALFGKRAQSLQQYITKGATVFVTGDFFVREYQRNDGTTGYSLDINADDVTLLDSRNGGGNGSQGSQSNGYAAPEKPAEDIPF